MDLTQVGQDLRQQGWSVSDELMPLELSQALLQELLARKESAEFQKAKIGVGPQKRAAAEIRGDYIFWLDSANPQKKERDFWRWLESVMSHLNQELLMGLCDSEIHYAFYPPHTQYEKHRDAFQKGSNRRVSLVHYLNPTWTKENGGELVIYEEQNPDTEATRVLPQMGRTVLFLSDAIYHRVDFTNQVRFSVTGWLKNRI